MNDSFVKNIFFFDSMLTPKIITFVYWLMLLGAVVGGIYLMFLPFFGGFFKGLGVLVGGVIVARIWCELLIVVFKINENAHRIAQNTSASPPRRDSVATGVGAAERQAT